MIKQNLKLKSSLIITTFIIFTIFCIKLYADDTKIQNKTIYMGSYDAVVKIKIFSSFTCPHCANFHINIVPQIKKEYVETGKVQLIFIDFPLNQAAFNASKLLHCLEKNKQMNFMDIIYNYQSEWTVGSNIEDINKNLKKIAKSLGVSPVQFDKCLIDENISDQILNGRIEATTKYSIDSTPTIIINEKKLKGSIDFENIKKKIEKII